MERANTVRRRRVRRVGKHVWSLIKKHGDDEDAVYEEMRKTIPYALLIELGFLLFKVLVEIWKERRNADSSMRMTINALSTAAALDPEDMYLIADDCEEDGMLGESKVLRWVALNSTDIGFDDHNSKPDITDGDDDYRSNEYDSDNDRYNF
ncbi:MAG: hypothetical protein VXW71_03235 [Actinomycetota bacterium]|nr:hypothetical protein [Actinomycetota bacterium]